MQLLIDQGANVNHENHLGNTALIWAALKGHKDVMQLLIDQGANIQHANNDGNTALLYATYNGSEDVAKLLRSNAATTTKGGMKTRKQYNKKMYKKN